MIYSLNTGNISLKNLWVNSLKQNDELAVSGMREQVHRDCFYWSEWNTLYSVGLPLTQARKESN